MDTVIISINDKPVEVKDGLSVKNLIARLGYNEKGVAVAVNRDFVPRAKHDQHVLKADDKVDIVAPMQGG